MYRQGDVLIEEAVLKKGLALCSDRLLVRGEGRNHAHYIMGEDVEVYPAGDDFLSDGGGIVTHFIKVNREASLEHRFVDSLKQTSEHGTIAIPPGTYRVIRQREYNPYDRAIRVVKD